MKLLVEEVYLKMNCAIITEQSIDIELSDCYIFTRCLISFTYGSEKPLKNMGHTTRTLIRYRVPNDNTFSV